MRHALIVMILAPFARAATTGLRPIRLMIIVRTVRLRLNLRTIVPLIVVAFTTPVALTSPIVAIPLLAMSADIAHENIYDAAFVVVDLRHARRAVARWHRWTIFRRRKRLHSNGWLVPDWWFFISDRWFIRDRWLNWRRLFVSNARNLQAPILFYKISIAIKCFVFVVVGFNYGVLHSFERIFVYRCSAAG